MIIDTPALMLDMGKIKKNIDAMQAMADSRGLKLRPHIKTHKMPELALLQIERGAAGITCASVSEACCMAEHGINDIFVAYPVIGKHKLERLLDLAENIRVIAGVDGREGASALSEAAVKRGLVIEARLEIDSGMRRAGVLPEKAPELARFIAGLPGIRLTGIFTFKSSVLEGRPTADNEGAAREESAFMARMARECREAGARILEISGGSTPTAAYAWMEPGLTEIRPGTYIFGDAGGVRAGQAGLDDCAGTVAVTVISTPAPDRAVIDGGSKAFCGDAQPDKPPLFMKGFGIVLGHEELVFSRMSEEHGVLESPSAETGLRVGQILRIVPNHICTALNLFDYAHIVDEDGTIRRTRILARGMSQ